MNSACPPPSPCQPLHSRSLRPLLPSRPSIATSLVNARAMTSKVQARTLRRVLPPGPGRPTYHHLPFPILAAKPLTELLHPPRITLTIVTLTTFRITLRHPTLPILVGHLRPPPTHGLPTNRRRSIPAPLRLRPRPRKILRPRTTFIATASLPLVKLSRHLPLIPMLPPRPRQPLPPLAKLLPQRVTTSTPLSVFVIAFLRLTPGSLASLRLLTTSTALSAIVLVSHLTPESLVRPLRLPLPVPKLPI